MDNFYFFYIFYILFIYAYTILPLACGSSFNDKPVNEGATGPIGKELFEKEQDDLLSDLKDIPKKACDRRVSHLHFHLLNTYKIFIDVN